MEPITIGLLAAGAGTALYGGISSEIRRGRANRALRNAKQPVFTPSPQMTSMYERTLREMYSPQGLTQQELGAAGQDIARGATTAYRLGTAAGGGNAAQALNAAVGAGMFGARSNLARMNAQRSLSNRQMAQQQNASVVGQMQNLSNQNVQLDIERLRALGQSAQQARIERDQAISGLGDSAFGMAGMQMGGANLGGTNTGAVTPTTIPSTATPPIVPQTQQEVVFTRNPRQGYDWTKPF